MSFHSCFRSASSPSRLLIMAIEDIPFEIRQEVARLSPAERGLIRQTFEKMNSGIPNYALALFIRLFAEHPEYKDIWPQFRAVADSALFSSQLLQNHAYVYMAGLKDIVGAIDNEEELCKMCKKIAFSHVKWNIYKKHIEDMVPELTGVMEKAVGTMDHGEKEAWNKLYDIIGNLVNYFKKQHQVAARSSFPL